MERRWHHREAPSAELTEALTQSIKVDAVLAQLLLNRGVFDFKTAEHFFKPNKHLLHDPFLMHGMSDGVNRILRAVEKKESILIYGDYDVDGTTAVSLVYHYLKSHHAPIQYYIPDRYTEGYGISNQSIEFAAQHKFSLIIALDCGIKALEPIEKAKQLQIDVIVCDHHLPGPKLPNAHAILNPKQKACQYPYKELSGAGIGFKLIQALSKSFHDEDATWAYLDLVVSSIAADMVPITGENRVLAFLGLQQINLYPRAGLKVLLEGGAIKTPVTISTLVFTLAPRINAAGRMKHAHMAVELLLCDEESQAVLLSAEINDTNLLRRDVDSETTLQAIEMVKSNPENEKKFSTVLFHSGWHKGIVGIVASRLIEQFYKPTIILTESDGKLTGSARSVRDFDLHAALEQCSDLLLQFGGHKFAAGLTLEKSMLNPFMLKFEAVASGMISPEQRIPSLEIEAELTFEQLTPKFLKVLEKMAPHGPSNLNPLFISKNVQDSGWAQVTGQNHLKLQLFQKQNVNLQFAAIAYHLGNLIDLIQSKRPFDIVYKIIFTKPGSGSKRSIQLVIEDLKPSV